jgi:hypothetical protein
VDREVTPRQLRSAEPELVRLLLPLGVSIARTERSMPGEAARVYARVRRLLPVPAVEADRAMGCIARVARSDGYSAGARAITQAVRRAGTC